MKPPKRKQRERIGNRLWRYRRRMGFTQTQVAAIVGYLAASDISHFEHGRRLPSLMMALKLEILYRVPVAFLFPELYGRLKLEVRRKEDHLRVGRAGHDACPTT